MTKSQNSPLAALICTHKRGAGLALFPVHDQSLAQSAFKAATDLQSLVHQPPRSASLSSTGASAQIFQSSEGSSWFSVCAGLTAENLADLYRLALSELKTGDAQVSTLGVVVGPGSFTGLRLGCAFVNGLCLGRSREVWSLSALHPSDVERRTRVLIPSVPTAFLGEFSSDEGDPFAVAVSFSDLLTHLVHWHEGGGHSVAVVEPVYGRDPTPVIKLRQQQGSPEK